MKIWLIGENNPYSRVPDDALLPFPEESAGARLCHQILGMTEAAYLAAFERRNLLSQARWSAPAARGAAGWLRTQIAASDGVVLLGRKVHDAWHTSVGGTLRGPGPWEPFTRRGTVLALPHPSGRCRAWWEPGAFRRAREAVAQLAPHLRPLLGAGGVR
jgi:hypothetical protein